MFDTVFTDSGTPAYSKNAGAWTNITGGGTLAMAAGDTLAVRCSLGSGELASFNIKNNAGGALIEEVTLTRT